MFNESFKSAKVGSSRTIMSNKLEELQAKSRVQISGGPTDFEEFTQDIMRKNRNWQNEITNIMRQDRHSNMKYVD